MFQDEILHSSKVATWHLGTSRGSGVAILFLSTKVAPSNLTPETKVQRPGIFDWKAFSCNIKEGCYRQIKELNRCHLHPEVNT